MYLCEPCHGHCPRCDPLHEMGGSWARAVGYCLACGKFRSCIDCICPDRHDSPSGGQVAVKERGVSEPGQEPWNP